MTINMQALNPMEDSLERKCNLAALEFRRFQQWIGARAANEKELAQRDELYKSWMKLKHAVDLEKYGQIQTPNPGRGDVPINYNY